MRLRRYALLLSTMLATLATLAVSPAGPAEAATPDRWGFAYVDNPLVPAWTTLDPTRQWGSWKTAFPVSFAEGIRLAPGRFLVKFPHVGVGARGNVHVTPVNRTGHYCEVVRWYQSGADEIVDVQCHKPGGARDDTPFTVLWNYSSGILPPGQGSYASLQYGPAAIVQSYNSAGVANAVVPLGIGQYQVTFPGVGLVGVLAGSVQATAVQPNAAPRRCKVRKLGAAGTDIIAYVSCFDQNGLPVNSEFTASYHRQRSAYAAFGPPKYFGYLWSAGAGPTNFNYPAGGFGFNSFGPTVPAGRYTVKYPLLGVRETHAQVTAFGAGSNYCSTSPSRGRTSAATPRWTCCASTPSAPRHRTTSCPPSRPASDPPLIRRVGLPEQRHELLQARRPRRARGPAAAGRGVCSGRSKSVGRFSAIRRRSAASRMAL